MNQDAAAPVVLLGQPAALDILLVLSLSFLLGLERERRKAEAGHYIFGGVRTFPIIGLVGYALARLAAGNLLAVLAGWRWSQPSCFSRIGTRSPPQVTPA